MTTPAIIILLKLPFELGMSHHAKATSGLHVVQGCGFRYWGTPHHASQRRTSLSLRTRADLYGGILTPVDIVPLRSCLISFLLSFFPVFRGTPIHPCARERREFLPLSLNTHILARILSEKETYGWDFKSRKNCDC
jgi:hypothetical protein